MQEICPKLSNNELIMKKIIHEIEKSKESTHLIRSLILQRSKLNVDDQEFQKALDHHSLMILNNIVSSLSMLRSGNFEGGVIKKRKINTSLLDHEKDHVTDDHGCNEETLNKSYPSSKNRRGCYKRRWHGQSRAIEVTHLSDDGFAWRKYGQKEILNAKHPRNYYRCTHKHEQNCQATKQVQQIQENPTKYMIVYHGNHTCNNNTLKSSTILLNSTELDNPSTIVLSFDQSNKDNPLLFPTSAFDATNMVIQEYESDHGFHNNNQYSSPSSDLTAITEQSSSISVSGQSEEIISVVDQNHCSTNIASLNDMEVDYYTYLMADHSEVHLDWLDKIGN